MDGKNLHRQGKRLFFYFFIFALFVIGLFFGIYKLFLGQAFADRGVSENAVPYLHTLSRQPNMDDFNLRFSCDSKTKVVDIPPFTVGMFPFFIKNTENTCNRAIDFVGIDRFLDAFLYGEVGIAKPATSSSKSTPFLAHHPGLFNLRKMIAEDVTLDRSIAFFWWMFPLPVATPSRGFAYTLFWGDFKELQVAASVRGFNFVELFAESISLLLKLNGYKADEKSPHKFLEQDHVFVKAYMSLQCVIGYTAQDSLLEARKHLILFMDSQLIRYPVDYKCNE